MPTYAIGIDVGGTFTDCDLTDGRRAGGETEVALDGTPPEEDVRPAFWAGTGLRRG